jgi:hypothetical protein
VDVTALEHPVVFGGIAVARLWNMIDCDAQLILYEGLFPPSGPDDAEGPEVETRVPRPGSPQL